MQRYNDCSFEKVIIAAFMKKIMLWTSNVTFAKPVLKESLLEKRKAAINNVMLIAAFLSDIFVGMVCTKAFTYPLPSVSFHLSGLIFT